MQVSTSVSSSFAASHGRHQVKFLVTVQGVSPVVRPPINAALVLDRSGSMGGEPLRQAREAALRFASFLTARDRLSVVAFDDEATLLFGPGPGDDPQARRVIEEIHEGSTTNLSAGWLEGHRQVSRAPGDGPNRVLVLTDGQANRGITAPGQLCGLAADARDHGITTTCIGFGPGFDEDLLDAMSTAGGGRFWFVESADLMSGAFEGEAEGLVSLAAQNLVIEIRLTHPGVAGVTLHPPLPVVRTDDGGWRIALGDLYATQPRTVGLTFHIDDATTLGDIQVAEVVVLADVVGAEGVEHRLVRMPVMASLDGQDHVAPEVETAFLHFRVAEARREAVHQADQGDLAAAARVLQEAAAGLTGREGEAEFGEVREDLLAEADRLGSQVYGSLDRKYQKLRAAMGVDGRVGEQGKFSRRRTR